MLTVRLAGIDAPETSKGKRQPGQPYSQKAKNHLAGLVLNKIVDIKGSCTDGYNRLLGVIYLEFKNINLEMVKAGLAEVYRGKQPEGFDSTPYLEAEKEAREAKSGMWGLGDEYISPREWRRMHRQSRGMLKGGDAEETIQDLRRRILINSSILV
jgi:endonuclease YncB( thermonuclease family)